MRVLYLTSFVPDTENKGQPSILSKLIYDALKEKYNDAVDLKCVNLPSNLFLKKLYQLLFYKVYQFECENHCDYDYIYVYPYWCINSIPRILHNKVRVIAPDLQSTLFSRMSKVQDSIFKRLFYTLLSTIMRMNEQAFKYVNKVYFVGQTDAIDYLLNSRAGNSEYIPHPMFFQNPGFSNKFNDKNKDNLILVSGAGGRRYYGDLLDGFLHELSLLHPKANVLITGKDNKDIVSHYAKSLPNLKYIDFVDNYGEIFSINNVVHVSPLSVGAGTKNRILDALTRRAICVTTEIGAENLHEFFDSGALQVAANPTELAKLAISSFNQEIDWNIVFDILKNRNERFKRNMIK